MTLRRLAIGERQPLLDLGAAGRVLEHDAAAHLADGFEASHLLRQRTAADLLRAGRRIARIVERRTRTALPSGVDAIGHPDRAIGLRRRELSARSLLVGRLIRAGRQRFRGDGVPAPHRGHAQQVDVERDPVPLTEVHDEPARRDVVRREARPGAARVEHRREEGELGLDPVSPPHRGSRRRRLLPRRGLRLGGLRRSACKSRRVTARLMTVAVAVRQSDRSTRTPAGSSTPRSRRRSGVSPRTCATHACHAVVE